MLAPRRSREPAPQRAPTSAPQERRSESPSPHSSRRAHAARTRGARPRTLTRAAHSRCLGPHPCAKEPRAPGTRRGPHPVHQTPAPCSSAQGSPVRGGRGRGVTEATHPVGRPGRVPQHRTSTARPAPTRGREEGAALRLGLALEIGYWGTPRPPSPPPFLQHKRLQTEPPSPCNLPGAYSFAASAVPGAAESETGAGEVQGCGAEIRVEAARVASRVPSPLPPRSAPATARRSPRLLLRPPSRPPPPGCRGAARQR